ADAVGAGGLDARDLRDDALPFGERLDQASVDLVETLPQLRQFLRAHPGLRPAACGRWKCAREASLLPGEASAVTFFRLAEAFGLCGLRYSGALRSVSIRASPTVSQGSTSDAEGSAL